MRKPTLKSITLKNLITFLMLLSVATLIILAVNFRSISVRIIEDKALAVADVVKAGITSHMKAEVMDKRDFFLSEIGSLGLVEDVAIIRSSEVNKEYGSGRQFERGIDEVSQQAFTTGQPVFLLKDIQIDPYMRAVVPFVASQDGKLDCLRCHEVAEGTVLGALDLKIDLTEYRNLTIKALLAIGVITTLFIILIIANNFRTVQKYIQEPLERLIKKGEDAYYKQQPINEDDFECLEFEHVAKEINLFTQDILNNQNLIQRKNQELSDLAHEIEKAHRETIFTMGVIEEQRSKETKHHTIRVTKYCQLLGEKLGLPGDEIALLAMSAPLHDIGKLGIPDAILLKPARLTGEEFEVMKNHTTIGYNMLKHSTRDALYAAATIAHQHHERWDGQGYPQGLAGEEIHVFGRIVALADVFDALVTRRIYKPEWALDDALGYLKENQGSQFDPRLVDALFSDLDPFLEVMGRYTR
jgi:response regulator RpfG family c-di-GMP phosphodiesterase